MKVYLRKVGNSYIVDSGDDSNIKNGEVVSAEIKRPRNYEFHRKFFALLNYAFGVWEPVKIEHQGKPVGKNFDRFRKDITMLAGYYEVTANIKGEAKAEPLSISFGSMGAEEFEQLYSKTIDVILKHVLKNYNREDIDKVVEEIIGFS